MKYYQHHIGDYLVETSHLTFLEDAAYSRLLRMYYHRECPYPADVAAVQRLMGARSKAEKNAVAVVLDEFFTLQADGWHHAQADEEITHYQANRETAQENGKKGGRPKTKGEPSDNLNETKGKPAKNPDETQQKPRNNPDETQIKPNPNPEITQIKANHKPLTNNQKTEETTNKPPPESRGREAESSSSPPRPRDNPEPPDKPPVPLPDKTLDAAPSRQAQIAVLLRRNGADPAMHPASRGIAEMTAENLTDTEILLALTTAKQNREASGSSQAITASYLLGIAKGQRQDGQRTARSPPTAAQRRSDWGARMAAVVASATASPEPPRTIDMGVIDASSIASS